MNNAISKLSPFGPIIVRLAMGLVFVWFGLNQLSSPDLWIGYVPDYAANLVGGNVTMLVLLNGWFELVAGVMLLAGLQIRLISLLLGLHLLAISQSLGYSALGIRDVGLSLATLSIFFVGPDRISLDRRFLKHHFELAKIESLS